MKTLDDPLALYFGWDRMVKGDVGIEVEIEGGPWPEDVIKNWVTHADGSLRNGIEYVIRQPVAGDKVKAAVQNLADGLANTRKVFSFRTSVHVHLNVQKMTFRQWTNFVTLFTIFEVLLVNQVGPERAGNKFCLRMIDAEQPLGLIRGGITRGNLRDQLNGDLKYASMNIRATRTHGTLEFRAMQGNLDVDFINDWVQLLLCLRDHAIKADNPQVFVEQVSLLGADEFTRRYLPADNRITRGVLRSPNLSNHIFEGVRLMQDIAYCTEWGKPGAGEVFRPKNPVQAEPDVDIRWDNEFDIGQAIPAPRNPAGEIRLADGVWAQPARPAWLDAELNAAPAQPQPRLRRVRLRNPIVDNI